MKLVNVQRLPYESDPPFDCRSDNATCPACRSGKRGDHGRHGGGAIFAMRGEMEDGRRMAVVLRVLLANWLPCTPRSNISGLLMKARGAYLEQHTQSSDPHTEECLYVGGRCAAGQVGGELTFMGADDLYSKFGNDTGDDNQSDAFWAELASWLRSWAAKVPALP